MPILRLAPFLALLACTDAAPPPADTAALGTRSAGCGTLPTELPTVLEVAGVERTFLLSIPPDYDPDVAWPVVFAWHGMGGSAAGARYYFGLQTASEQAIIVWPDALPLPVIGVTGWDLVPESDDYAFFDAMLAHVADNLCIDRDRVFSAGHSFGGYMSNHLGCYRSDVVRAIASVAGGPPKHGACGGEVATWLTHGTNDEVVAFAEGETALETWLEVNACSEATTPVDPQGCVIFKGCTEDVQWCEHGGNHDWPAFAGEAIWGFFQAQ